MSAAAVDQTADAVSPLEMAGRRLERWADASAAAETLRHRFQHTVRSSLHGSQYHADVHVRSFRKLLQSLNLQESQVLMGIGESLAQIAKEFVVNMKSHMQSWHKALEERLLEIHFRATLFPQKPPLWDHMSGRLSLFVSIAYDGTVMRPVETDLSGDCMFQITAFIANDLSRLGKELSQAWDRASRPLRLAFDLPSFLKLEDGREDPFRSLRLLAKFKDGSVVRFFEALKLMYKHEWDEDLKSLYGHIPKTAIVLRCPTTPASAVGSNDGTGPSPGNAVFIDSTHNLVFQDLLQDMPLQEIVQLIRLAIVIRYDMSAKLLHVLALQPRVYRDGDVSQMLVVLNDPEKGYVEPDPKFLEDLAVQACREAAPQNETFIKCWHFGKINRKGMEQERMLVLTNRSLTTMRFDFRGKKIDPNAGKSHSLDLFLCVDIGPFDEATQVYGSHKTGMCIYFNKGPTKPKKKKDLASLQSVRFHPSTEGVYENLFVSWNKEITDPIPIFLEVAWMVYAVVQAMRKPGSYVYYPYYPVPLQRPKPSKSAFLYNKTRKGYSTGRLRRRVRKESGSDTEGSVYQDDTQSVYTAIIEGLESGDNEEVEGTDIDVNDED